MWLKDKGYLTSRWNDLWGGINVRQSPDAIDDKQNTSSINLISEGNKLVTIPWYVSYYTPWSGVTRWQAISIDWKYILSIHNKNLYIFDTETSITYTKANAVGNATDIYNVTTTKAFSWNMSIICTNTNYATTEDVTGYEFDTSAHTFSNVTFVWLADKNFKCSIFFDWKLMLAGNPKFPSSLYYSKTGSVAAPNNLYDFSGYSSNAQNIGDWEPITWLVSNNWDLFLFKTNSVWRETWISDSGADAVTKSYAYIFRQLSQTGALNSFCICPVEQDVMYFDWINLRRVSYEANMLSLSDDSISKEVENIFKSLPTDQKWNATMYYCYPYVKLFLRDKFSSNNSVGIIYNIVDKSYSIQTWMTISQWVWGFVNNKRTSYFITNQTSTVYKDWTWYTYNWGNIITSHMSKRYVLWDWVDYKRISQVELYWLISPWLMVYVDFYVNDLIVDTRTIYYADILLPTTWSSPLWDTLFGSNAESDSLWLIRYANRYELFNDGRAFQFWVRSNGQWKFELHWINLMYKPIKGYDIH